MISKPKKFTLNRNARKFAIVATSVILISKLVSYIILSSNQKLGLHLDVYLNAHSILFSWMAPIFIVVFYEKRSLVSLGLASGRLSKYIYIGLVLVFIVLPLVLLNLDRIIIIHLLEQVLFIAFAEEVLWRGYFQKRLSDWIGLHKGILLSSFVFGLGHLVSIHAVEGYLIPSYSLLTLAQTSLGGLIFGFLFAWSRSIWPGAILHLFGNVFFSYIS